MQEPRSGAAGADVYRLRVPGSFPEKRRIEQK